MDIVYSDQPPNGESLEDVVNRVKITDSDILPSINNSENSNILIAHGNS